MLRLFLILTLCSLATMIAIDWRMGARAEFLNAWSVLERLAGREPAAGFSQVAERFGAIGEFVAVLLANSAVGLVLASLVTAVSKFLR